MLTQITTVEGVSARIHRDARYFSLSRLARADENAWELPPLSIDVDVEVIFDFAYACHCARQAARSKEVMSLNKLAQLLG